MRKCKGWTKKNEQCFSTPIKLLTLLNIIAHFTQDHVISLDILSLELWWNKETHMPEPRTLSSPSLLFRQSWNNNILFKWFSLFNFDANLRLKHYWM